MPRGRVGGRRAGGGFGAGRRAGHGFGGHHRAGHGIGGRGFGGQGIGGHHFHHRNNLFNNRHRVRGHGGHHRATNVAIHWNTDQDGVSTVSVTPGPRMNIHGSQTRCSNAACVVIFPILGMICFSVGVILGFTSSWTNSSLGIVGIALMAFGGVLWGLFILLLICLIAKRPNPSTPEGQALEAGAAPADPNPSVPNITVQGGLTNHSQAGSTATFVVQTNAFPPGLISMAQQAFNVQPSFPIDTTQTVQQPPQNVTGASNQPPSPSANLPYPPPQGNPTATEPIPNPEATAPPFNYPVASPQPAAESKEGDVESAPEIDSIPPPPSYDDVVTGIKGKHDEGYGKT